MVPTLKQAKVLYQMRAFALLAVCCWLVLAFDCILLTVQLGVLESVEVKQVIRSELRAYMH